MKIHRYFGREKGILQDGTGKKENQGNYLSST